MAGRPRKKSNNPSCPICGSNTSIHNRRRMRYQCNDRANCGHTFVLDPKTRGRKPTEEGPTPKAVLQQRRRARTGKTGNEHREKVVYNPFVVDQKVVLVGVHNRHRQELKDLLGAEGSVAKVTNDNCLVTFRKGGEFWVRERYLDSIEG